MQRDALGNALGGLRLPQIDAPTARYDGIGVPDACRLQGSAVPLSAETLRTLYPDHGAYLSRFGQAADRAVAAGVLLPDDAAAAMARAERGQAP